MQELTKEYQPKTLEEYICEPELKAAIQTYISSGSRKPIILHGPAGTGKTTLSRVICNELGAHMYDVNASMDNGIDKIREDVITWAKNRCIEGNGLKVIAFDEAEGLTTSAQSALKRTIEDHNKNTVFIFCTNNLSKIILPLQSRGSVSMFKLGTVSDEILTEMVDDVIARMADPEITDGADIPVIVKAAHGEPRKAINLLQSYCDGSFTLPVDKRDDFRHLMNGTDILTNPLELLHLITEDDLTEFSEYIVGCQKLDTDSRRDILMLIADTDIAMQRSVNKDVHLLNMIIKLSEL